MKITNFFDNNIIVKDVWRYNIEIINGYANLQSNEDEENAPVIVSKFSNYKVKMKDEQKKYSFSYGITK